MCSLSFFFIYACVSECVCAIWHHLDSLITHWHFYFHCILSYNLLLQCEKPAAEQKDNNNNSNRKSFAEIQIAFFLLTCELLTERDTHMHTHASNCGEQDKPQMKRSPRSFQLSMLSTAAYLNSCRCFCRCRCLHLIAAGSRFNWLVSARVSQL